MGYHQFTYSERIKLEALYESKMSVSEIANQLCKTRSTIYRELRRGTYTRMRSDLTAYETYSADIAQKDSEYKSTNKGPSLKLGRDFAFVEYIENKIAGARYSPAAALAALAKERPDIATRICVKTLYNYIEQGLFLHITNNALPLKGQRKQGYRKVKVNRISHPRLSSIEDRPAEIEGREIPWHWEGDTVYGPATRGHCLFVLTERTTRYEVIMRLKSRTQAEVIKAMNRLERRFGRKFPKIFKTITFDNGGEFLDCEGIEKSCLRKGTRTKVYYCHPYSSWERGSNENANAMIRRFIPKGTSIDKVPDKQLKYIENWMNNYPRRIFDYRSANEIYDEMMGGLI